MRPAWPVPMRSISCAPLPGRIRCRLRAGRPRACLACPSTSRSACPGWRRRRAAQAEAAERRDEEEERRTARVAERAREWKAAAEIGPKTPAGLYLAGRFCLADDLHPHLRSADNGSSSTLLAGMFNINAGEVTAYHETSLALQGKGWKKRTGKAKLVWGKAGGTIIPLALGPPGSLILSEGIENGLTAHLLLPGVAAAAAYSVGNLRAAGLAAKWDRVLFVRDREANTRSHGPACRAAAIAYWWEQGRAVTCIDPPEGYNDLNAAAVALRGQRNRPARPADQVWAEAGPIECVPVVAEWCRAHGLGDGPHLLRAHADIEANGRRHPALLAQLVQPDGGVTGLVARLLPKMPLVHPWREWGERGGTVVAIRPLMPDGSSGRGRSAGRLAIGLETALAAGAAWATLGLDHLAEAAVPASAWSLDLYPGATPTLADDVLMWREGLRRLHPGRELRVMLPPAKAEPAVELVA